MSKELNSFGLGFKATMGIILAKMLALSMILSLFLGTLFLIGYCSIAEAGGADEYKCVKVEKKPTCSVKTVVKYKTKVKYKIIDRPVQEVVMRYKLLPHKNRISIFFGQGYDNDAKVGTHTTRDHYGNVIDKSFKLKGQEKQTNIGIQYLRDIYTTPKFSIHGLIQYQTINGASVGLGLGF